MGNPHLSGSCFIGFDPTTSRKSKQSLTCSYKFIKSTLIFLLAESGDPD
jgi:hypothetical protein